MGIRFRRLTVLGGLALAVIGLAATSVQAQVTPAQGIEPIDDTPFVRVGGVLFLDYTYQDKPQGVDVNGDEFDPSSFNVGRAYINVTGQISHLISFRLTPDIVRETGTGSSISGSYTFRLKYAFAQLNFDQTIGKGSWLRFGVQQTPYVEYTENIYRYRFQGTIFVDREGFLTSSDAGLSFHYNFPVNYGDVHVGYYNGDGYSRADPNDEKAIQARVSVRPLPGTAVLQGLRVAAFYDGDNYASGDPKQRVVGEVTFEHKWVNAGAEYIDAKDKINDTLPRVNAKGYSIWATPRTSFGLEGLLRYDNLEPNEELDDAHKERGIAGVAYWFPVMKGVTAAALLDYEQVKYDTALDRPKEVRYALHTLWQF
jgi:hypothetical protein